jgi:hypothetical protein
MSPINPNTQPTQRPKSLKNVNALYRDSPGPIEKTKDFRFPEPAIRTRQSAITFPKSLTTLKSMSSVLNFVRGKIGRFRAKSRKIECVFALFEQNFVHLGTKIRPISTHFPGLHLRFPCQKNTIVKGNKVSLFFVSFFSREKKEGAVIN